MARSSSKFAVTAVGRDQVSPAMKKAANSFVAMARDAVASQDKVERKLKHTKQRLEEQSKAWKKIKSDYLSVRTAVLDVVNVFGSMIGVLRENAALAAEQERVEQRAIVAIRQRGEFTDQAFEALQRFNSENQQAIGIGDEQALQLQGTLAAMGLLPGQLEDATRATIGLAEATGGSLNEAAKIAAKVLQGNVGALKEYGITVETTEEALAELTKLYEVARSQSDKLATRVKVAEANFGDLREELGKSITKSKSAAKAMEGINSALLQMIDFMGSGRGQSGLDAFFSLLHKGLIVATDATRSMVRGLAAITGSDDLRTVADELYEVHKALELARQGFDGDVAGNLRTEIARRNVEAFQEIIATQEALRTILRDASLEEKAIHAQRIAQLELEIDERRKVFEESQGSLQPLLEAEREIAAEIQKKNEVTTQSTTSTDKNTAAQLRRLAALAAIREKMMSGQASLDAQSIKLQQEADAINMVAENEERVAAIRERAHEARMLQNEQAQEAQRQVAETVVANAERVAGELFNINRSMADNVKATGKLILQMIAQQIAARLKQAIISRAAAKSEAMVDAAGAAIKGGKAAAETPIVGPILAVAAATAVFAAMAAFTNRMQRGGMVPGGNTRGDSVPSLLEPGEFVVPRELVSAMAAGRPPRTSQAITEIRRADVPAAGPAQGQQPIQIVIPQNVPSDRTEFERYARRDLAPVLQDLGFVRA